MRKSLTVFLFFTSLHTFSSVYLKVVYISGSKADCGINKCFLIRENPVENYTIFNYTIEGFDFEEGYEYCLLVEIQTAGIILPSVSNDSTQAKYVLSEIKSKTKINNEEVSSFKKAIFISDSSKWMLYKLRMKDGTKTFSIQKAFLQFDINNNTINGNTECNSLNAGFIIDSTTCKFINIITTKMICGKHSIEPVFLNMMKSVTNYRATSKLLYLFKEKTLLALFTRKK